MLIADFILIVVDVVCYITGVANGDTSVVMIGVTC